MYRDELIATALIDFGTETNVRLDYYVRLLNIDGEPGYAMRVDMQSDTKVTPAFTGNYDYIVKMARAFAEGQVMPCTLLEMCDEWCGNTPEGF